MTDVIVEKNVPVPMQDGVRLFANVFRPGRQGRYPVLLQRTPYGKERAQMTYLMLDPLRAVGAGYVLVIQDTRGRANSLEGDGWLSQDPPGAESPDVFLYNPQNPVPTVGAGGVADQRAVERRTDVLVYSTPSLSEPLEVTGSVRVILYTSSSAPDTDFTAKLVDVAPNGYARNLCDGIIRTRYRNSLVRAELLQPGQLYELHIDLLVTSNLFRLGHQIRLEVSSSNFPRFDRNPNTGESAGAAQTTQPAVQTIYHDTPQPSHVLLPVIPRTDHV